MTNTKKWVLAALSLILLSSIGLSITLLIFSANLPSLEALKNYEPRLVTTVYSDNYEVVAEFSTEKRIKISIEELPDVVKNAFIAAEDDEFYSHGGINPRTILRAFIKNIQAGRTVQGGSTITQQVAKSILLSPERTIRRKVREVLLAFQIEKHFSKDEILEFYLNQIFLGQGAYGIEAAARVYFDKAAKELSLEEVTILAGLPRAPSRDNPVNDPVAAKQKQEYVLSRMLETKMITEEEFEAAKVAPIKVFNRRPRYNTDMPYFAEQVRRDLIEKYGSDSVYGGGLKVYTTINKEAQLAAQAAVKTGLLDLDKRIGYRASEKNLASDEEIEAYLQNQHQALLEEHYEYKVLVPEGRLDFPVELEQPTPLKTKKLYEGVLVDKITKSRTLIVQIGNQKGHIEASSYRWATESEGEDIYSRKNIRQPFKELKKGDIILVQVESVEKEKIALLLDQSPLVQGALISYRLPDGALHAVVGGYDFEKSEFNRAYQAKRQSGSTFKPIVYAAALEAGLTPATIIVDSPIVYSDESEAESFRNSSWKPQNYGNRFYGDTTLRNALAFSRNVPAIKIAQFLGVERLVDFSRKLGIEGDINEDLSMALGSSSVTLDELTRVWGVFANEGKKLQTHYIKRIEDRNGEILEEYVAAESEQVMSPQNAFLLTSLLQSVVDYGTGVRVKALNRPVAGKTGTTNDFKDASFVGYIPQLITSVWVGFDEDRPIGRYETGSKAAAPIWIDYMSQATKDMEKMSFDIPQGIVQFKIDTETGAPPQPGSRKIVTEFFVDGNTPKDDPPLLTELKTQLVEDDEKEAPKLGFVPRVITGNSGFSEKRAETMDSGEDSEAAADLLRNEL